MLRFHRTITMCYPRHITSLCSRKIQSNSHDAENLGFEPIFKSKLITFVALFNKLKKYQMYGTGIAVSTSAMLGMFDIIPMSYSVASAYIGITGTILLSLSSLITKNIIGFIYISKDNKQLKISMVDYWGQRQDRIVPLNDWIPLDDLPVRKMNYLFMTPQLVDGTKMKLFLRSGEFINRDKMSLLQ